MLFEAFCSCCPPVTKGGVLAEAVANNCMLNLVKGLECGPVSDITATGWANKHARHF